MIIQSINEEYCDDGPQVPGETCLAGTDTTGKPLGSLCSQDWACHCIAQEWQCRITEDMINPRTAQIYKVEARDDVTNEIPYTCGDAKVAGAPQDVIDECCTGCTKDSDCDSPPSPNNECWDSGEGCCQVQTGRCGYRLKGSGNSCDVIDDGNHGAEYKDDAMAACQPAAPTPDAAFDQSYQVPDACEVTLFGVRLYTYSVNCQKDCTYDCPISGCPPGSKDPLCRLCPPGTVGIYPDCQCPPGTYGTPPDCGCPPGTTGTPPDCKPCEPLSTDPRCQECPPGTTGKYPNCVCLPGYECPIPPPTTSCVTEGTCPPPECVTPPCDVEPPTLPPPPLPPTLPPTIVQPPVTPPFVPPTPPTVPPVVPPPPLPPPVFCKDSSTGDSGVTIDSSNWRNLTYLPEGYDFIAALNLTCSGNYIDMTINIPDNYRDVRAFIRYIEGGHDTLSSEVVSTAKCGDQFTETTRRQQLTGWDRPNYTHEELNVSRIVQAVIGPTDAERIVQSGRYSVNLLTQTTGSIIVKMSSPTFDVPPPAHPNLVIIGTPLLVTFTPMFAGKVRITMPYETPDFIDPDSLSMYVRVGGSNWRYLESTIDRENRTIVAEIEDISLFLGTAGSAVFAVMGITCLDCQKVALERLYDGGSRKAVVLVHGFTTDKLRWQAFIDDLVHTSTDWQVWLVGYPLSMDSNEAASQLSSLLEQNAAKFDKLSFIMHSMGGIVTQKALKLANEQDLAWPKKIQDMILAGQPGLGSPSADIYGRLFSTLVNLKSSSLVWSQKSPMLAEAITGRQVPRSPDAEYFVIAGRQSYPFTYELFRINQSYLPNDGVISIFSARTVGGEQITDTCRHYFELPRTHTDLLDDWLSRKVIQRVLFRYDAIENPEAVIAGYNKYIHIVDDNCRSGTVIVIGKHFSEAETEDPLNCKCGNGVCGEGETEINCPMDCVTGYKYFYICRVLPWFLWPLVILIALLSGAYVYRAINRHERGEGAMWIAIISAVTLLLIIGMYLFCGFTMPLAILVLVFVLALLGFTMAHLHAETKGHTHFKQAHKPAVVPVIKRQKAKEEEITVIDDKTMRKLENLLAKARGR